MKLLAYINYLLILLSPLGLLANDSIHLSSYAFDGTFGDRGAFVFDFNELDDAIQIIIEPDLVSFDSVIAHWDSFDALPSENFPRQGQVYWMRLAINEVNGPRAYLFGVNTGTFWNFDTIEVFKPSPDGSFQKELLGNHVAFHEKPKGTWANLFEYVSISNGQQYIYLRVQGFSDRYIPAFDIAHIDSYSYDRGLSILRFIYGAFIGLIFLQLIYYGLRLFFEHDMIHFYLLLFILGIGMWLLFLGIDLNYFILPRYSAHYPLVGSIGSFLTAVGLYAYLYKYLDLHSSSFPYRRVLFGIVGLHLILCLNYYWKFTSYANEQPLTSGYMRIFILSATINFLIPYLISILKWIRGNRNAMFFVLAFSPLILGILGRGILGLFAVEGDVPDILIFMRANYRMLMVSGIFLTLCLMTIFTSLIFNFLKKRDLEATKYQEIDEFKSRFFSNITHDLRTPLTLILGHASKIQGNENSTSQKSIMKNSKTILNMVNQLLDLAKVESNSMKINWVQSDIQGFISSIASDHLELADQKNITIHTVLQPQSLYMDYDPDMLQKIVSNLIANSIKYGNENNIIIIESIKSEEQLVLNIKDNGPGIDPVDQSSLFSRFFRGRHHQSSSITGFGIGLSLCKELSEILGGNITHHDNDLGGSTFSVHLPIHTDKAKVQVLSTEKSRDESIPSANPERLVFHENGKNILIVEDNSELIDLLSSILNPLYNLTTAKNGKEGLKYAKSQVPDLIISDVMMPEMDGIQMTKHLKTDILTSHIPVIMLTAKASHESKIEGLQTGANAYLTKPFSEEELLLKVKNGLNFVDALRTRFTETVAENTLVDPFIQRAIEIVEANIEKEVFNAQYLCGELNLSRSQVYRKLKALTGQNIQKFILDVRLRKSLSFLNDLSLTISEIAFKCGFNDPSHFSNAFFAYKGERPKDYRSRKA